MSTIIAVIGIVLVAVVGYFMYSSVSGRSNANKSDLAMETGEESVPKNESNSMENDSETMSTYNGKVLAGDKSPFIEFNKADYDTAKAEGKIIVLDFYANWCPICRAEAPDIEEGFDQVNNPQVIGFRVNYNDTETDDVEKALAQEYGVTYQHTKVILKDGKAVLKNGEVWDTERFVTEVNGVL